MAAGCASIQPPVRDPAVAALEERPAVIFVSGMTGTVLYDREKQRVTWGDARSTILPRDRGRAFAKPIGSAEDRVEVREPILDITLGPFYRYEVYRPITRPELAGLMATRGDLHAGVEGQDARSPGETGALAEPLIEVDGDHLGVIRSPASHRAILRIIARSGSRSPRR